MQIINQFKGVLAILAFLMFATVCLGLGRSSDGIFIIRRAVLDNAGGAISEVPSGGIFAMNNSFGQPSAIGISTVTGYPGKLYAGYQLPLILGDANSLTNYRVGTTLNVRLWWSKIPWATGYRIYTNTTDPFGAYTTLRATSQTQYTHINGVLAFSGKRFYRVRALRPWLTP